jgi:pimeloyl-ACP methyl ester carboxylesterase
MAFKKRMKAYPDSQYNEFRFVYLDNLYSHMNHKLVMSFYYTFVEKLREELPEVSGWKGKALLIDSRDDGDTIDKFQELIDTYPGAEIHLFETGGHHAHMLFPQEFTQIAAEFLKS